MGEIEALSVDGNVKRGPVEAVWQSLQNLNVLLPYDPTKFMPRY